MKIDLPQGRFYTDAPPSETVLLVAGGRPPCGNWLKQAAQNYPLWAVDRGVDFCKAAGVPPEMVIGDADSCASESWKWAESLGVSVKRHPVDKDLTDLQLTLRELGLRRPGASVLLTGGMGRRFDHAFSNIYSLLETDSWGIHALGLADEKEAVFFLQGGQALAVEFAINPLVVSLLPFSSNCTEVQSQGLHWPLNGKTLTLDHPGGICNRLEEGSHGIRIELETGLVGVYLCWDESGL